MSKESKMGKAAEIVRIKPPASTIEPVNGKKSGHEIYHPELVDEIVSIKLELDKLKKRYTALQSKAKAEARKIWVEAIDSGSKPENVKFLGESGHATVSAKLRPKTAQRVNKQKFIDTYGRSAFDALFTESVSLELTSTPEAFIDAAIEAGLDVDKFFDIQTSPKPVEGCFANLAGLKLTRQDVEGVEADLYALHNSPTVTVTKKK
jgi:hypothetical protein